MNLIKYCRINRAVAHIVTCGDKPNIFFYPCYEKLKDSGVQVNWGFVVNRGGRIQLLMFSVSHFLAEQQTITVSEISNFLIHCTLNVHFNCTIVNLKQ